MAPKDEPAAGIKLRTLRDAQGLTRAALAQIAELSPKTVQRSEAGRVPTPVARARLATALGVRAAQIWDAQTEAANDPGAQLRALREERGLSAEDVIKDAKISSEHLRRIERGDVRRPSDRTLAAIGEALGVDPAKLWKDFHNPEEVAEQGVDPDWRMPLHRSSGEHMLELVLGTRECPADAPLLTAANPTGWSVLERELRREPWGPSSERVLEVCRALTDSSEGMLLAYLDLPDTPRPLGLVQPDKGTFYRETRPPAARRPGSLWRDFYHDAAFGLLELAERRSGASDVQLSHLTVHGWPEDLIVATFEGLGHLVDSREQDLQLRTIHLDPCCLPESDPLDRAVALLNKEQRGPEPPTARPLRTEPVDPSRLGLARLKGLEIVKVELPSAA